MSLDRGVLYKAIREAAFTTCLLAIGLLAFHSALAMVLPTFQAQLAGGILSHPFVQNLLRGMLGSSLGDQIGPQAFRSIVWVHPVTLALLWAHEILFCTRLPAAEIDRGSIDVLLGLPVSRWQAYRSESLLWLVSGIVLVAAALTGNLAGSTIAGDVHRAPWPRLVMVVANLLALYVAVGGIAYLVSACSDRRGRAAGLVFAVVLLSFFLLVLGRFWAPARWFAWLGVLNYFRPHLILQCGDWPMVDMAVLVGVGLLAWTLGGYKLARRDICTV
jgi:hypothetical protein